jgi:plastocyanin
MEALPMKTLLGACALISAASMFGCTSDDEAPASTGEDVVNVRVASDQFTPASVKIKVGQTVRWTWGGGTHNVVSGSDCNTEDGNFKSGAPQGGGTFDKKFEKAGTFPYHCQPHCAMGMKGEVVVEP